MGSLLKKNKHLKFIKNIDKGNFRLFFVCIFLSVFLWFLVKLSKTYNSDIVFNMSYYNVPKKLVSLNDSLKDRVKLRVNTTGFKILSFRMKNKTLPINLKEILKKNYTPFEKIYWKVDKSIFSTLEDMNGIHIYDVIYPKNISFNNIKLKETKKVPVKLKGNIVAKSGFCLRDKLLFYPDSIEIIGSKKDIKEIKEINTEKFILKDLEETIGKNIKLNIPKNIKTKVDLVHLEVLIEEVVEKKLDVKIKSKNFNKEGYNLKIIPEKIEIMFNVGASKYENIKSTSFEVYIDFKNIEEGIFKPLKVKVKTKENIEIIKITPEVAEYIIKKQ